MAEPPARPTRGVASRAGPLLAVLVFLLGWEAGVRAFKVPAYLLPGPVVVGQALVQHFPSLAASWWVTVRIMASALLLAVAGGLALGAWFALSPRAERLLSPFAVVLQVTPVIAVAPLVLILTDSALATMLVCAWIVAFFPILASTVTGLRSADARLRDLFRLYRASRWQTLRLLLAPSAAPYVLNGLQVAGGLALIGAVVAEFTAGAAGRETGLASRILEASFRTEIPKMFAALVLVSATGVAVHALLRALTRRLIGAWHESQR
jgi:NitT/TauT family transport system permease protein